MSLIVSATSESNFKPVPAGSHLARCYRIIDLGTQKTEWQGNIKHQRKIMVQFEVHGQDDDGYELVTANGEPLSISKNYTLSLGENSGLRKDLKSWRKRDFTPEELKGFELKNILGQWAMLTVTVSPGKDGREYTNISAINPVHASVKSAGLPAFHNKAFMFSISDPDMDLFNTFGDKLKAKITSSPEWQARSKKSVSAEEDEDIPF